MTLGWAGIVAGTGLENGDGVDPMAAKRCANHLLSVKS
jgi:hypothetical protein